MTTTPLNATARAALRDADITVGQWARYNDFADGQWYGDACGCPDDRCIGFHHADPDDCGCLGVLMEQYRP